MATYADLGALGAKQGPPVTFIWTRPNVLPPLLPWLVVLALLALPSNRKARAWLIWAPLAALALVVAGAEAACGRWSNEAFDTVIQAPFAAAFGLAAIWLLGGALARRCRGVEILLMALAFAAVSLVALMLGPVWELVRDVSRYAPMMLFYVPALWIVGGLVYAGALNLTGWRCRKRFGWLRVSLWLPVWLWIMWIVAAGGFGGVMTLVVGESIEWIELLVGASILSLVAFLMILPFLILSLTSSFYRERLRSLLRLPAADSPPVAATPPSITGPGSLQ